MARLTVIEAGTPAVATSGQPRADESLLEPGRRTIAATRAVADTAFNFAEKQKAVQDAIAVSEAHAGAVRELDDYRVELDKDGDYATKAQRFQDKAAEVRKKYGDKFDGETQARFVTSYDSTALAFETSVRHAARKDEVDQGRVAMNTANEELILKASAARSDVERDAILKQVDDNLQGGVQTGILSAAQHKEARRQYLGKYDEALAQRGVRTNPAGMLEDLKNPDKFKYLDPVRREVLATAAQTRLDTLGSAARMEARADAQDLIVGLRNDIPPADYDARLATIKRVVPKVAAQVESEQRASATVANFRVKPLLEQQRILEDFTTKAQDPAKGGGLTGEERGAYMRMAHVHQQEIQRWVTDPFTTSIQTSPTVKELFDRAGKTVEDPNAPVAALDASVEWQQKNGIPAASVAVISRGQAQTLATELGTLDGVAFNQRIAQLKQQYGGHFDTLLRQVSAEGKGSAKIASLQTALEQPDTPLGLASRANLIDAGKIHEGDLKKLFPTDADLTKTQIAVEEQLGNFRQSLGGAKDGMATAARYRDDAVRLAASFQLQGLSAAKSAERAVEQLVSNHYAFLPDAGTMVRVPRTIENAAVNVETVRTNIERVRAGLEAKDLAAPPDLSPGADPKAGAEAFAARVKQYARWQTAQGGRGAVLVYEANGRLQPVMRKNGTPVSIDFTAPEVPLPKGMASPWPTSTFGDAVSP